MRCDLLDDSGSEGRPIVQGCVGLGRSLCALVQPASTLVAELPDDDSRVVPVAHASDGVHTVQQLLGMLHVESTASLCRLKRAGQLQVGVGCARAQHQQRTHHVDRLPRVPTHTLLAHLGLVEPRTLAVHRVPV